ncbi:Rhodanese domain protein [Chloroherpeton thalassium ATCC 35110]|uniref:Rhodanese domain protein n=1 Tax=Chloroherpeton thalassium (strain ATCC 35110 / GB-78) TaxID=517418 RepID=B3QW44_CHLT3|nr:rhodanese-like domain-containing protein [Chloroherpeton thalassium]ACF14698.1 Rhodanese domain protein [Chloroherpeton thalassium ATCC 35110]
MFETLGVSRGLFALLLAVVALLSFVGVTFIEKKVNKTENRGLDIHFLPVTILTGLAVLVALFATLLPERKTAVLETADMATVAEQESIPKMTADELAYRLMDDDHKLQIFDFRPIAAFKDYSLPKSVSVTPNNLFEKETAKLLSRKGKMKVFLAEDEESAVKLALAAQTLGFKNISVLKGGLREFKQEILDFSPTPEAKNRLNEYTLRFRSKASHVIPILIEQNKNAAPVKKKAKRVLGGC